MKNPLFLCGPANCGTNLVKAILGVNENVHLESEPFLPLFQYLRTEILKKKSKDTKTKYTDPLFEYYFSKLDIDKIQTIQNSNLKVKINKKQLNDLKKNVLKRMDDYVPHLKKDIKHLKGLNYKSVFDSAIKIIDKNHQKKNIKWIGWMDSWIEEFFPILAREYPKAKFVLILRDPRAAIASYKNYFKKKGKPNFAPMTLSYLRCWRKQLAFIEYFKSLRFLRNRFVLIKYEDLVNNPKKIIKKLCIFLNIKYSSKMLDSENFMGLGKNTKKWTPNSNFNVKRKGIYKNSLFRWKKNLSKEMLNFIQCIVGPELKFLNYEKKIKIYDYNKILNFHKDDHKTLKGWRTSYISPEKDIRYDFNRNLILTNKKNNKKLIKYNFLFKEIYYKLIK